MTHACRLLRTLVAAVPFVAGGCLEVHLDTRVNADGSIVRREVVTGDSAETSLFGFLSPVDSTWHVSFRRTERDACERTAEKRFENAEALTAALADSAAGAPPVAATLERRFLWFYSDLTYRERYSRWNPFGAVPLSAYLSAGEIARAMRAQGGDAAHQAADSAAREKLGRRWTEWTYRDMFEDYFGELMTGVRLLGDPELPGAAVAACKEDLFSRGRMMWASPAALDTLGTIVRAAVHNPRVQRAIDANAAGFARHQRKLSRVARVMGKLTQVAIGMPGSVIETNAAVVDGNRGVWKGVAEMSYTADYELRIASRIVNWWCIAITALLVLAATVMLLRSRSGWIASGAKSAPSQ